MAKPQLNAAGHGHLFSYPYFSPPASFGLQFVDWGEGGPSGDMSIKQSTPIPAATTIGFCGVPVTQQFLTLMPMPQGIPLTRPASPQTAFGQASTATPLTYIRGAMKAPGEQ